MGARTRLVLDAWESHFLFTNFERSGPLGNIVTSSIYYAGEPTNLYLAIEAEVRWCNEMGFIPMVLEVIVSGE
jgi:hypothetical protein